MGDASPNLSKWTPPDNNFASLSVGDITIVLSTGTFTLNSKTSFTTSTLLVYAERILLGESIQLPSKSLGLFCNTFDSVKDGLSIDVSGINGDQLDTDSHDPGKPLVSTNAGSIVFSVERLLPTAVGRQFGGGPKGILLRACGGKGKTGAHAIKDGEAGENGGPGGNGGSIRVYFGTPVLALAEKLSQLKRTSSGGQSSWLFRASEIPQKILSDMDKLKHAGLFDFDYDETTKFFTHYSELAGICTKLELDLKHLLDPNFKCSDGLKASAKLFEASVLECSKSANAPLDPGIFEKLQNVSTLMTEVLKPVTLDDSLDANLLSALDFAIDPLKCGSDSPFDVRLLEMWETLLSIADNMSSTVRYDVCIADKGAGGKPGAGAKSASTGIEGKDGPVSVSLLRFNKDAAALQFPDVLAQPDQCQMLLNIANEKFFTGKDSETIAAATIYSTLTRRLDFVPKLLEAYNANLADPRAAKLNLLTAYWNMENLQQLTMATFTQLDAIHSHASSALSKIMLGQDEFGHGDTWAPRSSFSGYLDSARVVIDNLKDLEKMYEEYRQSLEEGKAAEQEIDKALKATTSHLDTIKIKIDLLVKEGGPMNVAASQIVTFSPQLKAKRKEISDDIKDVEVSLKLFNMDPSMFIEALSMVAMAPHAENVIVQLGALAYKGFTMIKGNDDHLVEKSYIVTQLKDCDGTIESLTEGFSAREDKTIEVDDPGAAKLMMAEENLTKLIGNFSKAISGDKAKALQDSLTEYNKLIKQRNDAVITYNSAVQVLCEALQDREYYTLQQNTLGQKGIITNPRLPAISFWLQKTLDDKKMFILQTLSYASRALCYWGLRSQLVFSDADNALPGSTALTACADAIDAAYAECKETYGSNPPSLWPQDPDKSLGFLYKLTDGELATLVSSRTVNGTEERSVQLSSLKPPDLDDKIDENPFVGCADIRLQQVRFWLPKAKVNKNEEGHSMLHVVIECFGEETIQDWHRTLFHFTHDDVLTSFWYNTDGIDSIVDVLKSEPRSKQLLLDNLYDPKINKSGGSGPAYAAIGPFATWRISLPGNPNPGLDLEDVEEAYLEFCGWFRSFQKNT